MLLLKAKIMQIIQTSNKIPEKSSDKNNGVNLRGGSCAHPNAKRPIFNLQFSIFNLWGLSDLYSHPFTAMHHLFRNLRWAPYCTLRGIRSPTRRKTSPGRVPSSCQRVRFGRPYTISCCQSALRGRFLDMILTVSRPSIPPNRNEGGCASFPTRHGSRDDNTFFQTRCISPRV